MLGLNLILWDQNRTLGRAADNHQRSKGSRSGWRRLADIRGSTREAVMWQLVRSVWPLNAPENLSLFPGLFLPSMLARGTRPRRSSFGTAVTDKWSANHWHISQRAHCWRDKVVEVQQVRFTYSLYQNPLQRQSLVKARKMHCACGRNRV
jgi:hypothetical protein